MFVAGRIIMAGIAIPTAIWMLSRAGNSQSDIIKTTVYAKTIVYRAVAKFYATGDVEGSHNSPR